MDSSKNIDVSFVGQSVSKMYENDLKTLVRANEIHGTDGANARAESSTSTVHSTVFVHHECMRTFTDKFELDMASKMGMSR